MRMHDIRERQSVVKRFLGQRMNTPASSPPRVDGGTVSLSDSACVCIMYISLLLTTYISTHLRQENNDELATV